MNLEDLARVAHAGGNVGAMARLLAAANAVRDANGISLGERERESFDAAVSLARRAQDETTFASLWAEGRASPLDDVLALIGAT